MAEIIPAVLPRNYEEMKDSIALVRGVVPIVQIDICDGIFVPSITWPFLSKPTDEAEFLDNDLDARFRRIMNEQEGIPFWEEIDFELDLMVAHAPKNFDTYMKLGPRRVVFHIEAAEDLEEFRDFLEGIDTYVRDVTEIGVAINTGTPLEDIFPLVPFVDFVQCMGIEKIGFQGEEFDPQCLVNIKTLKEKFPDLVISVDGGVNLDTAPQIIKAGADRIISGSAIFNTDDIIGTVEMFKQI